jgi:hypothetical protein
VKKTGPENEEEQTRYFYEKDSWFVVKARLVALGFQEDISDEAVDAPTGTKEGLRLLMFIAVQKGWTLHQRDATRAFLQSEKRTDNEKVIRLKCPKEANEDEDVSWILIKSIYGLRSAPKAWWNTITKVFLGNELKQLQGDKNLFMLKRSIELDGLIHLHVDDVMYAGEKTFLDLVEIVCTKVKFGEPETFKFEHLGLEIQQNETTKEVRISQVKKIEALKEIEIKREKKISKVETR